jgi:hypothetical protein
MYKSISSTFYEQILSRYSFAKKLQSQNVSREKLRKTLSKEKGASKLLMKLTPVRKKLMKLTTGNILSLVFCSGIKILHLLVHKRLIYSFVAS